MNIQHSVVKPRAELASLAPGVEISPFLDERFPPLNQLLTAHEVARLVRRPRWYFCSLALIGGFPVKRRFRGRWAGWIRSDVSEWIQKNLPPPSAHPPKAHPAKVIAHQRRLPLGRTEWCPSIRRRRRPRRHLKGNGLVSNQVPAPNGPTSFVSAEDRQ